VKHPVHFTTIYRLLARHGWRKLVPRPSHRQPLTERSKLPFSTTSLLWSRPPSPPVLPAISGQCC
jgi:hypothetical protein